MYWTSPYFAWILGGHNQGKGRPPPQIFEGTIPCCPLKSLPLGALIDRGCLLLFVVRVSVKTSTKWSENWRQSEPCSERKCPVSWTGHWRLFVITYTTICLYMPTKLNCQGIHATLLAEASSICLAWCVMVIDDHDASWSKQGRAKKPKKNENRGRNLLIWLKWVGGICNMHHWLMGGMNTPAYLTFLSHRARFGWT